MAMMTFPFSSRCSSQIISQLWVCKEENSTMNVFFIATTLKHLVLHVSRRNNFCSRAVSSNKAAKKRKAKTGKKAKYFFLVKNLPLLFMFYFCSVLCEREPVALQQSYEWARFEERRVNFWVSTQRHPHEEFNNFSSKHKNREENSVKRNSKTIR